MSLCPARLGSRGPATPSACSDACRTPFWRVGSPLPTDTILGNRRRVAGLGHRGARPPCEPVAPGSQQSRQGWGGQWWGHTASGPNPGLQPPASPLPPRPREPSHSGLAPVLLQERPPQRSPPVVVTDVGARVLPPPKPQMSPTWETGDPPIRPKVHSLF